VLGFLSVSTLLLIEHRFGAVTFQSRAGFSECLDEVRDDMAKVAEVFQSRAGFSECLDRAVDD